MRIARSPLRHGLWPSMLDSSVPSPTAVPWPSIYDFAEATRAEATAKHPNPKQPTHKYLRAAGLHHGAIIIFITTKQRIILTSFHQCTMSAYYHVVVFHLLQALNPEIVQP